MMHDLTPAQLLIGLVAVILGTGTVIGLDLLIAMWGEGRLASILMRRRRP